MPLDFIEGRDSIKLSLNEMKKDTEGNNEKNVSIIRHRDLGSALEELYNAHLMDLLFGSNERNYILTNGKKKKQSGKKNKLTINKKKKK